MRGVEEGGGEDGQEADFEKQDVPLEGKPCLSDGLETEIGQPADEEEVIPMQSQGDKTGTEQAEEEQADTDPVWTHSQLGGDDSQRAERLEQEESSMESRESTSGLGDMRSESVDEQVNGQETVVGEESFELHEQRGEGDEVDGSQQTVEDSVGGERDH